MVLALNVAQRSC